jgi:TfoX/Sxy family transcriptional regulator of competence genes
MSYDAALAARVQKALGGKSGIAERKMFGGLCYLLHGNMAAGIVGDSLMVRVGPDAYEKTLARPHARPMDFTGRPLKGMVYVGPGGCATAAALSKWLARGLTFAASLPKK